MTKVLVVDDSPVDRTLIEHVLRSTDVLVQFAENGAKANQQIREDTPDIVITDLMMPEMDGLQLVEGIRRDYTDVPVILMTSRSTERTAIEALQAGAASFVPKSRLADRLLDTLRQVLALKRVDHPYHELLQCLDNTSSSFCLASKLSLIPQLVDLVQRGLASMHVCDVTESIRLSLALEEGLLNALVHGTFELTDQVRESGFQSNAAYFQQRSQESPFRDRRIFVQVEISITKTRFVIRDEGPGFDTAAISSINRLSPFEHGFGRGLTLMRSFMHEVSYNDVGNELTLVKQFE